MIARILCFVYLFPATKMASISSRMSRITMEGKGYMEETTQNGPVAFLDTFDFEETKQRGMPKNDEEPTSSQAKIQLNILHPNNVNVLGSMGLCEWSRNVILMTFRAKNYKMLGSPALKIKPVDCTSKINPARCSNSASKFKSWGYDTKKQECVFFWRGNCGGNRNHYPTQENCELYCAYNKLITTTKAYESHERIVARRRSKLRYTEKNNPRYLNKKYNKNELRTISKEIDSKERNKTKLGSIKYDARARNILQSVETTINTTQSTVSRDDTEQLPEIPHVPKFREMPHEEEIIEMPHVTHHPNSKKFKYDDYKDAFKSKQRVEEEKEFVKTIWDGIKSESSISNPSDKKLSPKNKRRVFKPYHPKSISPEGQENVPINHLKYDEDNKISLTPKDPFSKSTLTEFQNYSLRSSTMDPSIIFFLNLPYLPRGLNHKFGSNSKLESSPSSIHETFSDTVVSKQMVPCEILKSTIVKLWRNLKTTFLNIIRILAIHFNVSETVWNFWRYLSFFINIALDILNIFIKILKRILEKLFLNLTLQTSKNSLMKTLLTADYQRLIDFIVSKPQIISNVISSNFLLDEIPKVLYKLFLSNERLNKTHSFNTKELGLHPGSSYFPGLASQSKEILKRTQSLRNFENLNSNQKNKDNIPDEHSTTIRPNFTNIPELILRKNFYLNNTVITVNLSSMWNYLREHFKVIHTLISPKGERQQNKEQIKPTAPSIGEEQSEVKNITAPFSPPVSVIGEQQPEVKKVAASKKLFVDLTLRNKKELL